MLQSITRFPGRLLTWDWWLIPNWSLPWDCLDFWKFDPEGSRILWICTRHTWGRGEIDISFLYTSENALCFGKSRLCIQFIWYIYIYNLFDISCMRKSPRFENTNVQLVHLVIEFQMVSSKGMLLVIASEQLLFLKSEIWNNLKLPCIIALF